MLDLTFLKFHGFEHSFNCFIGLLGSYPKMTYRLSHFKDVAFLSWYKVEEIHMEYFPEELK